MNTTIATPKESFQSIATHTPETAEGNAKGITAADISFVHASAIKSEQGYFVDAVICGQMMIEKFAELKSGHVVRSRNRHTPDDEQIGKWLAKNCPEIDARIGRRWRVSAERAIRIITGSQSADPVVWIEVNGERFYISTVLRMPPADAPPEILTFQGRFRGFLADKSHSEVMRCALVDSDTAHNIDRAANGKAKGGTRGEDRRDYAKFVKVHFKEMNHLISRWDKFISEDPSQHSKMTESLF